MQLINAASFHDVAYYFLDHTVLLRIYFGLPIQQRSSKI